jgi:protein-S-isoprenylcysteine O-methyltransferase Ste14
MKVITGSISGGLMPMSQFKKWSQKEHSFTKRIVVMLFAGIFFLGILPYLFLVVCPSVDERLGLDRIQPGAVTMLIGGIIMVCGFALAFWTISKQLDQGRGTPLPIMPTQELIISGPFRYCRNPMTLGAILAYLGLSIGAATAVGVALVLLFGSLLIIYLRTVEEKELAERFGESYLEYKKSVPFIVPRIPKKN